MLGYQLMCLHLPFYGALVLVILGVLMFLYIPHSGGLVDFPDGDHIMLHKAPVRLALVVFMWINQGVDG